MIIPPESWSDLWDVIEDEFANSSERGLAIIASSLEVESVCAVKMLQTALSTRGLRFSMYCVSDYADLQQVLERLLASSEEMRTLLFINCCASRYVRSFAPASCVNARFVVIDSRRPIDPLYNQSNDTDCVLLLATDDPLPRLDIPQPHELDSMSEADLAMLKDDARQEAEDEEEREAAAADSPAEKRPRLDADGSPAASRRVHRERLRLVQQRQRLLEDYWSLGSSYGKPTPLLLLPFVELLKAQTDNTLLWPAVVGLTDQWLHERVSPQHFERWSSSLADAVSAADANYQAQQLYQAQQQERHGPAMPGELGGGNVALAVGQPTLLRGQDYKLMLLRHWTLYNALVYSPYLAPRLQTWQPQGRRALAQLLAKMGILLEQAQTSFEGMLQSSQTAFQNKLRDAVHAVQAADTDLGLRYEELTCSSFLLRHNRQVTAASDMVHACEALLTECAIKAEQGVAGATARGFWAALEALDCHLPNGWAQLLRGVEAAKVTQQAIIEDGGLMCSDKGLRRATARAQVEGIAMQVLNLHVIKPANASVFRHPLTLLRLAQFVRDATRLSLQKDVAQAGAARTAAAVEAARRLAAIYYPILAIGPEVDEASGDLLVIGLRSRVLQDQAQYNLFGQVFPALQCVRGSKQDGASESVDTGRISFDAATVYVHEPSLGGFLDEVSQYVQHTAEDGGGANGTQQQQQQQQQQCSGDDTQAPRDSGPVGGGSGGLVGAGCSDDEQTDSDEGEQEEALAASDGGDVDMVPPSEDGEEEGGHQQQQQGQPPAGAL